MSRQSIFCAAAVIMIVVCAYFGVSKYNECESKGLDIAKVYNTKYGYGLQCVEVKP